MYSWLINYKAYTAAVPIIIIIGRNEKIYYILFYVWSTYRLTIHNIIIITISILLEDRFNFLFLFDKKKLFKGLATLRTKLINYKT